MELKQFDKVYVAEDVMGAGCIDECNCKKDLNIKKKEEEE